MNELLRDRNGQPREERLMVAIASLLTEQFFAPLFIS